MKTERCPDIAIDRLAADEPRLAELRDFSQKIMAEEFVLFIPARTKPRKFI